MKKFNKNEIEDIVKLAKKSVPDDEYNFSPSFFFWPSGIMFIFALTALRFWLINPNLGILYSNARLWLSYIFGRRNRNVPYFLNINL